MELLARDHPTRDTAIVAAIDRFSRYKQEGHLAIRQAGIKNVTLDTLRIKRKLLLGMAPEKAREVIGFQEEDLNVFEALALAKREGKIIVPNQVHDRIIEATDGREIDYAYYPVWTGTMVIYPDPGKPFGDKMVSCWKDISTGNHCSITLDIPARFRGKTGCALVVEHPDFDLVMSGENAYDLICDRSRIHLHKGFPDVGGTYGYDGRYRLPRENAVGRDTGSYRKLERLVGGNIGLVARGYIAYHPSNDFRDILIFDSPSDHMEVALF